MAETSITPALLARLDRLEKVAAAARDYVETEIKWINTGYQRVLGAIADEKMDELRAALAELDTEARNEGESDEPLRP